MKQQSFITLIIALIVIVVGLSMSVYIVNPSQQVVVKRLSEVVRVETKPGLYFKVPFLEQIVWLDNRELRFDMPTQSVQVNGGLYYEVDAFLIYHISDPALFIQKISNGQPQMAEQRNLAKRFTSSLRSVYASRSETAALSSQRVEMMREVKGQLIEEAKPLGIDVVDVRILKTDLTNEVSKGIFDRMNQQQYEEAEQARAEGNAERIKIIAEADRKYEEIVAAANRDGQIWRGQGDADAAKLMNDAVKSNPDFYQFWLTMDKYQNIKDTPMVITPDWSFFDLMRNPNGVAKPQN